MVSPARPVDVDATGSQPPLTQDSVRILELETQVETLIDEREKLRIERNAAEDELAVCMARAVVNEQALKLTDKQREEWIEVFRTARQILKGTQQ